MPELPEAEYMVRRLRESPGVGARVKRAVVRDEGIARRLRGREIVNYFRRAKNVLVEFSGGWVLRVQLGMTGHIYAWKDARNLPRFTRAHWELEGGGAIVFEDARTFGSWELHPKQNLAVVFSAYGPEPLDPAWRWQDLRAAAERSRGPVKPFLLDQSRVAGLGNIWAAEALWEARIDPFRSVAELQDKEWKRLHGAIRAVLAEAIEGTFAVTSRPEEFPDADLLQCRVYGRENQACRRCRRVNIVRLPQAGRSTFLCPSCQK